MSKKLKFSDSILVILALSILLDKEILTIIFILSAFIHELGHLLSIVLCRAKILSINITIFGGVIKYHYIGSKFVDVFIALSGPFFGFLAAYIFSLFGLTIFSGANLILSIINILPIMPLDGGRIVTYLFNKKFSYIIGFIFKIVLTIFSVYIFIKGYGISLILFVIAIWLYNQNKV